MFLATTFFVNDQLKDYHCTVKLKKASQKTRFHLYPKKLTILQFYNGLQICNKPISIKLQ